MLVVPSLRGRGTERVVVRLAESLLQSIDVTIIQLSEPEPFYPLPAGVQLHRFGGSRRRWSRHLALLQYLFRTLRDEDADVVVSFGETINPFVVPVARSVGVPVFVSNRASPSASLRGARKWLHPLLYPFANGVIVQTRRSAEILSRHIRQRRWIVLENPIDVPPDVMADSARDNICVNVGYLGGKKNQAQLIQAFLRVAPQDWRLVIVGDGPDRLGLERMAVDLGGTDRVEFTGSIGDVDSLLARAKVFAFTSLSEGFPNALAEAMAHGCACVALDIPTGPAELIEHGRSGFLVPASDPRAYDRSLESLMTSPSVRSSFGQAARKRAKRLASGRIAATLLDEFQEHIDPCTKRGTDVQHRNA